MKDTFQSLEGFSLSETLETMSETHLTWWELIPTVDHVEPVAQ